MQIEKNITENILRYIEKKIKDTHVTKNWTQTNSKYKKL